MEALENALKQLDAVKGDLSRLSEGCRCEEDFRRKRQFLQTLLDGAKEAKERLGEAAKRQKTAGSSRAELSKTIRSRTPAIGRKIAAAWLHMIKSREVYADALHPLFLATEDLANLEAMHQEIRHGVAAILALLHQTDESVFIELAAEVYARPTGWWPEAADDEEWVIGSTALSLKFLKTLRAQLSYRVLRLILSDTDASEANKQTDCFKFTSACRQFCAGVFSPSAKEAEVEGSERIFTVLVKLAESYNILLEIDDEEDGKVESPLGRAGVQSFANCMSCAFQNLFAPRPEQTASQWEELADALKSKAEAVMLTSLGNQKLGSLPPCLQWQIHRHDAVMRAGLLKRAGNAHEGAKSALRGNASKAVMAVLAQQEIDPSAPLFLTYRRVYQDGYGRIERAISPPTQASDLGPEEGPAACEAATGSSFGQR